MHEYLSIYLSIYIYIYSNIYIYITYILLLSLSLSDLVWRLPECWCWQMWQLRGPIFGGWKGGRMWCPFGVPSRYVWSANVFMLFVWAILPAQVSLPSLVEVVGLLHNWIRSPSRPTAEWRSSLHVLVCAPYKFGPRIAFWGLIWVIFWSLFWVPFLGAVLGPWILFVIVGAQNGAQKWNPKQGPKYNPNQDPKNAIRGSKFVRRRKQGRVEMIFIQRSVCLAILFNCATNQQLQPKKEGKLGRAKILKQRAWIPRRYPDWSPEMSGFLGAKIRPRLNTPFCVYCAIGL